MKKYLFLTNGSKDDKYFSKDNINLGNMSKCCILPALDLNYKVFMSYNRKYASTIKVNDYPVKLYDAHIYRSIFDFKENYIAYRNLNKVLKAEKIDVIHCNTPIGGVLGRICGHKNKTSKVIYTVHGFHFYKGNNKFKNFIFRSIEKYLARWSDAIITMNQEDYEAANKFKLRNNGKVYFVHGVGIDLEQFKDIKVDKIYKKHELGLNDDDNIIISVGDINKNKNISLLIDIIAKCNNPKIKCLICGSGNDIDSLKDKASKLHVDNQILFLGFRKDIKELLKIADIYVSTSLREGLPRALMEAMASGLPCVVSNIRGNTDLIRNDVGGFCCDTIDEYVMAINSIAEKKELVESFKNYNLAKIKEYDIKKVINEIKEIYKNIGL